MSVSLLRRRRLFIGVEGTGLHPCSLPLIQAGGGREALSFSQPEEEKKGHKKAKQTIALYLFLRKKGFKNICFPFVHMHRPPMLQNKKNAMEKRGRGRMPSGSWISKISARNGPNKKARVRTSSSSSACPNGPCLQPSRSPPKKRKFLPPFPPKLRTQSNREAGRRSRAVEITRGPRS